MNHSVCMRAFILLLLLLLQQQQKLFFIKYFSLLSYLSWRWRYFFSRYAFCSTCSFIKWSGGFDFTVRPPTFVLCITVIELFEACFVCNDFWLEYDEYIFNDYQKVYWCRMIYNINLNQVSFFFYYLVRMVLYEQ